MKTPENDGSQFSRRSQNASTAINDSVPIATSNKLSFLFSLFDHIAQHTLFPKLLSFIVAIFFYLQVIFGATWPYISYYQKSNSNHKVIQKEVEIFWFLKHEITNKNARNGLIVNLVVFLICAAWLLYIGIFYLIRRKFIIWTLYPTRTIFEIISLIFIHPSAASAGFCFMILVNDYKSSIAWIQFIVCLIIYLCFLFTFIIGYSIMCSSTILISNIFTTFEPIYMIILAISSSLMVFCSFMFYSFEYWVMNIMQIIHILVFLYIFWSLFSFHFHQLQGTILIFSVLSTSLILDLLLFILNIYTKVTTLVPVIASYSLFVVSLIVGHFLIKSLYHKSVHKLKIKDSEDDNNFFKSLNIDSNTNKALKYFRLGLSSRAMCFIDMSLAKYIVTNHKTNLHVLISLLQIVTFFPMNKMISDLIFGLISNKMELKLWQKFTLYQSYKVKILRQSSIPLESNEKILHLRMALRDCESVINSLWTTKIKPSVGVFETILKITSKTESFCQESIREYPNNVKLRDDYCRFLIECKTDFKSAVIQKHQIGMIENGFNFSTDYSFKRFVLNYPSYLKKNVIDVHGNFIGKKANQNGNESLSSSSSSSNNRSKQTYSSNDDSIDFEIESSLAKSLISQSKLRMSLYNATKKYHLTLSKAMIITAVVSFIASLVCFILTNSLLTCWIRKRSLDSSNSQTISNSFFNLNVAALDHIISFATQTGRYPISSLLILQQFSKVESGLKIYISFYGYIKEYATQYLVQSETDFQDFLDELTNQAKSDLNIYKMANSVFNLSVPGIVCRNKVRSDVYYRSLKDALSDLFYDFLRLNEVDSKDLYTSDAYCEIPKNLALISETFMNLFVSLLYEQNSLYVQFKDNALIVKILMPIILFVLQFFPFLIVSLIYSNKMKKFSELLMKLNSQTKENCRKPIMLNSEEDEDQYQSDRFYIGHQWNLIIIFQACLSIIGFILLFLLVSTAYDTNEDFNKINCWQFMSSKRFILSTEITHFAFQLVINNGSVPDFIKKNEIQALLSTKIPDIRTSSMNMLRGREGMFPTSVGFDSELDNINFKEYCDLGSAEQTDPLHDLYRCASATHAVNVFSDFALTILLNAASFNGCIADPLLVNFVHLANSHLFERLSSSNERLVKLVSIYFDKFCFIANLIMSIGIIIGLCILAFQVYASFYSNKLYHVGLSLVRRIPPILFVADKDLLNFVFNQHSTQNSHTTCPSQSVILHSKSGMIGVSAEGTIEIINRGLTEILGYSPEQLLGQPIDQLFKEGDGEKVTNKMIEIIHGRSPLINEDHLICIADNGNEVQCQIFIIGLKGKVSKIDSFAFLINDESSLIEQRLSAEKAKGQSENLLFQILPRSIVSMINRGDREISFTVPSASIIFTDIIKFSEYSATLAPAEVMGNLSTIFASFDEAAKNYNLITKIKLIGDIYMAAAGLFANEENPIQPIQHAEQIIHFGLDCIEAIDQNNLKLNSNLQLRIGVNSGGPLIAGVLGSDKPVFDIIGDPINVAARLQTTDLPGRIQIPQSTYDLIADSGFLTEERGEVFLKGKGKTMAYFVSPMSAAIASLKNDSAEE